MMRGNFSSRASPDDVALVEACSMRSSDNDYRVRELLSRGADVRYYKHSVYLCHGTSAIEQAIRNNRVSLLPLLLGLRPDVYLINRRLDEGSTLLIWACKDGHTSLALQLIGWGAEVQARDYGCHTPLMHASLRGNTVLVGALIAALQQRGGSVFRPDGYDRTPFLLAATAGHLACVLTCCSRP
jgi:ankyrin repeat protein